MGPEEEEEDDVQVFYEGGSEDEQDEDFERPGSVSDAAPKRPQLPFSMALARLLIGEFLKFEDFPD